MTTRKPKLERPSLIAKVEAAYESLLDGHFGHIVNPQDETVVTAGVSLGTAAPAAPDDAPPPNMLDQLKLLNSITAFIELKHKLHPEDEEDGISSMVDTLRGETKRVARRAQSENGAGFPAILHRADESPDAPVPADIGAA
jgi:hypothetical protein